jgi:hypothetical protein
MENIPWNVLQLKSNVLERLEKSGTDAQNRRDNERFVDVEDKSQPHSQPTTVNAIQLPSGMIIYEEIVIKGLLYR